MQDHRKQGIRLRHLEQVQEERKRDLSPGAANRKKIFQKLPQPKKTLGRVDHPDQKLQSPKVEQHEADSAEYQKLVQNLKRKSMEVQLRDNMIKSLNQQIDQLKKELKNKDGQIERLKEEMDRLQKMARSRKSSKNDDKDLAVFQSFRGDPGLSQYAQQPPNFNEEPIPTFKEEPLSNFNRDPVVVRQSAPPYLPRQESHSFGIDHTSPQQSFPQSNSYSNFNSNNQVRKNSYEEMNMSKGYERSGYGNTIKEQEPQILSPFMALTSNKRSQPVQKQSPSPLYEPFARQTQTFTSNMNHNKSNQYAHSSNKTYSNPFDTYNPSNNSINNSHSSSFSKKPGEFDIFKEKKGVDKDKFNIFGNQNSRMEPKSNSKLNIDDSQEFRFQDFDKNDYHDF